jgi:hypothetical protein
MTGEKDLEGGGHGLFRESIRIRLQRLREAKKRNMRVANGAEFRIGYFLNAVLEH